MAAIKGTIPNRGHIKSSGPFIMHHRRLAEQDKAKTDTKGGSVFQGKAKRRLLSGNRK